MPFFTKESLETLRQRVTLIDVISQHIELRKSGASYKALCPFHDEKSPSFVVQPGDSHYHCFGCGAHGDAIEFLMSHLKMSFLEAVENLADKFHVRLEEVENDRKQKGPSLKKMREATLLASRFFHFNLLHTAEGHQVLDYLYKRGINLEFIHHFRIGLAPKREGMLQTFLSKAKVSKEVMNSVGLITEGRYGRPRAFFSDRITFPILDPAGHVIGFSARKYKEETFGGKYINSTETPLFKKSRVLFGIHHCRRRIAKERKAIIVEGQIDALKLIQQGFDLSVAGQGTAFGEGQLNELLKLGVTTVYLAMDGDKAGKEAAEKIGHLFQKSAVEVFVIDMPDGSDPDTILIEKGVEGFLKALEESNDYITFLVQKLSTQFDMRSPAGKNQLINTIAKKVKEWNDPIMVHESLRKLARVTDVPEDYVGVHQAHTANLYIKKSAVAGKLTVDPDKVLEADLLRWLILLGERDRKIVELVKENLEENDFKVEICKEVFIAYLKAFSEEEKLDLLSLARYLDSEEEQALVSEVLEKKVNKEKAEEQLIETIKKILDRNWMLKREAVKQKIQAGNCSDDEAILLAKEFDTLRKEPPQLKRVESCEV